MTRVIVISAIVHVVLVVLLPFAPRLTRAPEPAYDVYSVELVEVVESAPAPAVEQTVEPPPEEEPVVEEEAPSEEPEIPEEPVRRSRRIVTTPPPRQERSLAERLADRLGDDEEREPAAASAEEPVPEQTPTASTTVSASRFPYAWYLSIVQGKVKSNWRQPGGLLFGERELKAVVSFRIRRDGTVGPVTVRRSSGRATLDQSAARAVQASTPFPPLPDDYREDHLDVTIDFAVTRNN
ncbi:MAG: TonB family protein [Candidatus Eisenbacteria bacterium]|nr:TonB family protein [Candidatus Eisenbacteria bacterium]